MRGLSRRRSHLGEWRTRCGWGRTGGLAPTAPPRSFGIHSFELRVPVFLDEQYPRARVG